MTESRYPPWSVLMPDRTDIEAETQRQKARKRELARERRLLDNDESEETWSDAHHVVVVSKKHHLDNVEASDQLLALLNIHHGRDKGFSDGYSKETT